MTGEVRERGLRPLAGALGWLRRFTEVQGGAVGVAEERELDGAVVHDRVLSVLPKPQAAQLKRLDDRRQRLTDVSGRPGSTRAFRGRGVQTRG